EATPFHSSRLKISGTSLDVAVAPVAVAANDAAAPLMFGMAQGGLELGTFAASRPAPTGVSYNPGGSAAAPNLLTPPGVGVQPLAGLQHSDWTGMMLNGVSIGIAPGTGAIYQSGTTFDGIRQHLQLFAAQINAQAATTPGFRWKAAVWGGYRLA